MDNLLFKSFHVDIRHNFPANEGPSFIGLAAYSDDGMRWHGGCVRQMKTELQTLITMLDTLPLFDVE